MGDSAAVAVLNVIGDKPVNEERAERILEILAMAFETPRIIRNPADRKPTVTLSLLDFLEAMPLPLLTIEHIGQARETLEAIRSNQ